MKILPTWIGYTLSFVLGAFLCYLLKCPEKDMKGITYLDKGPPPKIPTIFEFMRSDDHLHISERNQIIQRASEYLFNGPPPEFMENYIIIDENKYWYIYFGARGNGLLDVKGGHLPIFEGTDSIYLDKETMEFIPRTSGFIRNWDERIPSIGFETKTNDANQRMDPTSANAQSVVPEG